MTLLFGQELKDALEAENTTDKISNVDADDETARIKDSID